MLDASRRQGWNSVWGDSPRISGSGFEVPLHQALNLDTLSPLDTLIYAVAHHVHIKSPKENAG